MPFPIWIAVTFGRARMWGIEEARRIEAMRNEAIVLFDSSRTLHFNLEVEN